MRYTPILLILTGVLFAADPPKPKHLSAEDAIQFVEAAALRFQALDAQKESELQAAKAQTAAKEMENRFFTTLAEIRTRSGVGAKCDPVGTGDKDPAKRYAWKCEEAPVTKGGK